MHREILRQLHICMVEISTDFIALQLELCRIFYETDGWIFGRTMRQQSNWKQTDATSKSTLQQTYCLRHSLSHSLQQHRTVYHIYQRNTSRVHGVYAQIHAHLRRSSATFSIHYDSWKRQKARTCTWPASELITGECTMGQFGPSLWDYEHPAIVTAYTRFKTCPLTLIDIKNHFRKHFVDISIMNSKLYVCILDHLDAFYCIQYLYIILLWLHCFCPLSVYLCCLLV